MAGQDNKKHYICRDIKFRYILNLFVTERLFRGNKIVLYYLNPNKVSMFFGKFSKLLTRGQNRNFSFFYCNYDISMMKNEKGISLIKASGCDDLNEIINKIDKMELSEGRSIFDCLNEKLGHVKKDLKLYIKQQVALEIFNDLIMVNMAHWLSTNRESQLYGKNLVLIMEKNYWSQLVLDYLKSNNVKYIAFCNLNPKQNKGIRFTYYLIKLIVELTLSIAKGWRVLPPENGKIGVPFYVFQNFTDFIDLRNYYLFWFYKSSINPEDILIYLPDARSKINKQEALNIKNAKFNLISCSAYMKGKTSKDVPVYVCSLRAVSLLLLYLKEIIRMYRFAKSRLMKEQWKLLSILYIQLPYWEDFFTKNNIKIKFRFHDMFSVRDIAAKLSGTITLSYHYSNHSDARITREEVSDVFFIWSKKYKKILSPEYSTTGTLVETGYIFDYTFNVLKKNALALRYKLKQVGVSYTIGLFDENISRHINYFTNSVLRYYKAVLEYAVAHSDIGIIVKPKKEISIEYLKSSVETADLLSILEKQNRIVILDSSKYPAVAGYASDIVLGIIPDSTAGLECALAGIPMVIYDCSNRKESHPLYKTGHNKIIFDDIQYLIKAIDENKKRPGSISGFADWSFILNEVDQFRDGKANQRVADYIKTLLQKSNNGLSRNEAIEAANRAYAEGYGWDKVISLLGEIGNIKHGKQRAEG